LKGEVVGFTVGLFNRLLVDEFGGIYEVLFVGEFVKLVLGKVVGVLLDCSFVGENVGDENIRLLVRCAVEDEVVANEMIANIDGVRVGASVGIVVGNFVG
jgi:hypothetical protein